MKRDILTDLIHWRNSNRRKPLILGGARQVGKTHILKAFGASEYRDLAYFNFDEDARLDQFFEARLEPIKIIEKLNIYRNKPISAATTLIVFDEVQRSSRALNSLKYFHELAPEYHIVAAGSLLGIKLSAPDSFPVGKVNLLSLYPLSFFEFLDAVDKSKLRQMLEGATEFVPLDEPFHQELIELLRTYYFVGGMPEAVAHYLQHRDLQEVREIHREILDTYLLDFTKHAPANEVIKIRNIWEAIPGQLGKENRKFIFSAIRKSARARDYEVALQWLINAGLIYQSHHVASPQVPLKSHYTHEIFKVFLLDVGLLAAMCNISATTLLDGNKLFTDFNGAFVENYVAQELTCSREERLYYWTSEGTAEVDFLVEDNETILPLEVKAGVDKKKKSLRVYADKYRPSIISRASLLNLRRDGDVCNYPLYAVRLFPRLSEVP
jgi:uncharacterized protein